ncbi:MAG: hypothetical protein IKN53_04730, partial [Oscillibacter sp.]|nr:hypothetical protein [Oscillibacter sp.]
MGAVNEEKTVQSGGKRVAGGGKKPLWIALIALGVAVCAYVGACAYAGSAAAFPPNARVNGVAVGGMTVGQAQQALEQELLRREITLTGAES